MREVFHFDEFTLDPSRFVLRRGDRLLRLENRPMELLILLVQRHGELVSREEVAQRLWGTGVYVDADQGINTAVRKVRMALRDNPDKPRYVKTVIGKGYLFAAAVSVERDTPQAVNVDEDADPSSTPSEGIPVVESSVDRKRLPRMALLLVATLCGLILASSVWLLGRRYLFGSPARAKIQSVAVLPLKNLSNDPGQEYLADGLTEELIGRLAGIHDLRVISRTSSMRFKSTQLTAPEISKELGADALVEGSVIREGNHIRVHAQLIRGTTDEHFWSETYDRELPDVLSLQSDVAQAIAERVKATITGTEHDRLAAAHKVDPEAYELYLKGRFALNNSNKQSEVEESVRYFDGAIAKDPAFAPAYVGLAGAHMKLGSIMLGGHSEAELPVAKAAVLRALQLDANLTEAHVLLADIEQAQWHWAEAQREYQRALELSPNDASAHEGLAWWLVCQARFDEALVSAERARELDQFGTSNWWGMAWVLFQSRRYDEAIQELHSILAVRGDDAGALWLLGFILTEKGETKEAIRVLEKAAVLTDRASGYLDVLAAAYAKDGRRDDAVKLLNELKARKKKTGYLPAASFVIIYLGMGDKEQAFSWLDQAYKERSNMLQFIKVHPLLDPLRDDPRFTDLIQRIGLATTRER